MKRVILAAAMLACLGASACKKSSTATAPPTVTISPTSANVEAGTQEQFGATVANATAASGTAITWLVNGVSGISAQQTAGFGTIDSNGLYTAPNVLPASAAVTITAELTGETSIYSIALVIITQVPVVTLSPTTATIAAGQPTTLTVCLFNVPQDANKNPETGVTWYVNGIAGGNSTFGTVAAAAVTGTPTCTPSLPSQPAPQQAVYTAPKIPPSGGQVLVSVVLDADTTQTASSTITDTFSSFSLQGSFVFNLAGTFAFNQGGACTSSGYFARAGRFTADGQGGLTVVEDVNVAGSPPQNLQVNGTYTIGADGRGTAVVKDSFACGTTASNYYFVFVNESEVQIAEADTFATGHGEGDVQDPNVAFTGNLPANNFAFDFSGSSVVGGLTKPTSQIGQFSLTPSGAGAKISNGQEDLNAGGALTTAAALSGTLVSTDTTGRGTATIQGASFVYYMITAGRVRFLETDASGTVTGDALQQPNNPTFSASSLSAECSFLTSGRSPTGLAATGGVFFADGASLLSNGVVDQNNAGTVQPNAVASGNYTVAANGRGTFSLTTNSGTLTFVFYLVQAGQAVVQETDSLIEADGMLVTQQGVPGTGSGFTTQSLVGPFAQQWTGAAASSPNEADTTGQIVLTGPTATAAAALKGTWDTNNALTLVPGNAVTGTYSMAGNGRGTLMITDANGTVYNMSLYMSSLTPTGSVVFVLGTDTSRVLAGQITEQF